MKRLIAVALLALAAGSVHAEDRKLVALYSFYVTPEKDAITFELGEVPANPEMCQGMAGVRIAQVSVTNPSIYPQVIPYGSGCWYPTDDGVVIISYVNFETREVVELVYPQTSFKTSRYFTKWSNYKPVSKETRTESPQDMIDRVDRLAGLCMSSEGSFQKKYCAQMQQAVEQANKAGLCFGPYTAPMADRSWRKCS